MRNFWMSLFFFCAAIPVLTVAEGGFSMEAAPVEKVIHVSDPLKIKLSSSCPDGYSARAWRLVAYVPNLPADFVAVTGAKVTPSTLREWDTVFIMNWEWTIPTDGILVKSTDQYPSGDYKMSLYIHFSGKTPDGEKLPDKMISQDVLFTLKKGGRRDTQ